MWPLTPRHCRVCITYSKLMIQVLLEASLTEQRTKIISPGSLLLLKWSFRQAFNYSGKGCWALIVFPLYTVSLWFLTTPVPGECCIAVVTITESLSEGCLGLEQIVQATTHVQTVFVFI